MLLDFEDGQDVFGMEGLDFSKLKIEQGAGDYADAVIVSNGTEFLLVIQTENRTKVDLTSVTIADFPSSDPSDQNLSGTTGNDILIGGFGNDQVTTGAGVDEVYTHSGTDQVTVDGAGNKTLNGGSGQDTLDINYSGVADLSALSTSYDSDSDTLTFTTQSGDVITASNFEIFKIAGNGYSFVYNGFASSKNRQIGGTNVYSYLETYSNTMSHAFVRLDGTEVFTYLPEASNCYHAGPIITYGSPGEAYTWESSQARCTNLSLGLLAQLRPSHDVSDWQANQSNEEWNDLTIKVYGSDANDLISDGGWDNYFKPQGYVITTGAGDDSVGLVDENGYYDRKDNVDLGAGDDIGVLRDWSVFDDWDGGAGNDWLSFAQSNFYKHTTESGEDCFTPGPGNRPNDLYSLCGNNYKWVQLGLTYALNTGKTKNFENIVGSYNDDTLTGDSAGNIILGGGGSDVIRGLAGDDVLAGSAGKVRDDGNSRYRVDNTLSLSRTLFNNSSSAQASDVEQLFGGAGDDVLYGSAGDDSLDGGTGSDELWGGPGDDSLDGGAGSDRLWSGPGFDTIILRAGAGAKTVEEADLLLDFEDDIDEIALDGVNFGSLTIEPGQNDYAGSVIVRNGTEFLLVIQTQTQTIVDVSDVTEEDFTTVD